MSFTLAVFGLLLAIGGALSIQIPARRASTGVLFDKHEREINNTPKYAVIAAGVLLILFSISL